MDISKISVNSQNSIRVDAGKIIYFDPFKIDETSADADYIFITHDHYDHYSPEDINKVIKNDTKIIIPESMEKKVRKDFGDAIDVTVVPGESYKTGEFSFEAVAMYNIKKPFHLKKAQWCGYIVEIEGTRIYVAGDIDAIEEAKQVKCDIAMIPIGGFYTLNYKEGAELINVMKPKIVIPTHYGTGAGKPEDGGKFKELVDASIQVVLKLHM